MRPNCALQPKSIERATGQFSVPNYFFGGCSRYHPEFFKHSCVERILCSRAPQNVIKLQAKHPVYLHHLRHARPAFASDKCVRYLAKNSDNFAVVNVRISAVQIA
jgi:hypothetical protein